MIKIPITFERVFDDWMARENNPVIQPPWIGVAKEKGFDTVYDWRRDSALRLGMDKKQWMLETIPDPVSTLPQVIVGPYQGWSLFFDNRLGTTFAQAMEIPEFFQWTKVHNRIPDIAEHFPQPTTIILYRKPNGQFIHIEGGHRLAAVAYANKIGRPVTFLPNTITAAVADITSSEVESLIQFLKQGTNKQKTA